MKYLCTLLAVMSFFVFFGQACAENVLQPYCSVKPGVIFLPDLETDDFYTPIDFEDPKKTSYQKGDVWGEYTGTGWEDAKIGSATNPGLTFAVGGRYSKNIRTELELGYRHISLNKIKGTTILDGDIKIARQNTTQDPDGWPTDHWEEEGRVSGSFHKKLKGHLDVYSLLVNVCYEFSNRTIATPYLSAGYGAVYASLHGLAGKDKNFWAIKNTHKLGFAYQIGGGVGILLSEQLVLDCSYSYFDTPIKLSLNGTGADGLDYSSGLGFKGSHNIGVGVRYAF